MKLVKDLGQPISMPIGDDIRGRLFNVVGSSHLLMKWFVTEEHDIFIIWFIDYKCDSHVFSHISFLIKKKRKKRMCFSVSSGYLLKK